MEAEQKLHFADIGRESINEGEIMLDQYKDHVLRLIGAFNVTSMDTEAFNQIRKNENNFHILKSLIETDRNLSNAIDYMQEINYSQFLRQLVDFFDHYQVQTHDEIVHSIKNATQRMTILLTEIDKQLTFALHRRIESTDGFAKRYELLDLGQRSIESNDDNTGHLLKLIGTYNITSIHMRPFYQFEKLKQRRDQLLSVVQVDSFPPINKTETITYQYTEFKWYSFLSQCYDFFASFEVQRNVS